MSPGTDEGAIAIRIPSPMIASASGTSMAALAGRSFWARTRTVIADIQVTLMTLSATSISISPMLEPTQYSPSSNPEPTLSRQRRGKCCLSGVSSQTPAAIGTAPAARGPCGRYSAYTATPTSVQTTRYDPTNSGTARTRPLACARFKTAGAAPGSIIAAIIGTHRATKNANEPSGVAMPMSIPLICRTATTQHTAASPSVAVRAVAVAAVLVLVMTAPPNAGLVVAALGGAVEPLVHAPKTVQSARIGGIGVVDNAVIEHERAHARPLARVSGHVGPAGRSNLGDGLRNRLRVHREAAASEIVFYAPFALLLLGEGDVEVDVEVAVVRGGPGKRPAQSLLVGLQLRERRPRHRRKRDVMVRQVDGGAIEAVRDRRAGRASRLVVGPEHEMINEKLRAPAEEVRQRGAALVGVQPIFLVDPHPRHLLPPPRQFVPPPRQRLFSL